ncbi:hypothetical protein [Winogradskyella sp. 3972H.M.0a.05]|uniref:hypothetical protein n=1 Tax=Winogradskyella sp. 3972H.M.0a.05 TaxID=2950277 RepID=UPI0033974FE9
MNLSKRSKIALSILVLVILGGVYAYKVAYKPHKTIDEREVKFSGTAQDFIKTVKQDATIWQDVVVELSGSVTAKDEQGLTIEESVFCQLQDKAQLENLAQGQTITIKARMIGFDDLLEELKLDQTKIIE